MQTWEQAAPGAASRAATGTAMSAASDATATQPPSADPAPPEPVGLGPSDAGRTNVYEQPDAGNAAPASAAHDSRVDDEDYLNQRLPAADSQAGVSPGPVLAGPLASESDAAERPEPAGERTGPIEPQPALAPLPPVEPSQSAPVSERPDRAEPAPAIDSPDLPGSPDAPDAPEPAPRQEPTLATTLTPTLAPLPPVERRVMESFETGGLPVRSGTGATDLQNSSDTAHPSDTAAVVPADPSLQPPSRSPEATAAPRDLPDGSPDARELSRDMADESADDRAAGSGRDEPREEAKRAYEFVEQQPANVPSPTVAGSEMEVIAGRADACVRKGFELAGRGAFYAAKLEFHQALRIVAQSLDAQQGGTRRMDALAAGLEALAEADSFVSTPPGRTLDLAAVVASHRTPVLKGADLTNVSLIAALQQYYTYAQEQLAVAGGQEPVASVALYGLGKTYAVLPAAGGAVVTEAPKGIALHQAALLVDSRNYMAANELGVLLARCGQLQAARAALQHSVRLAAEPATWRNLARVHEMLGETSLAREASHQAQHAASTASRSGTQAGSQRSVAAGAPRQPVVWVDPSTFAAAARAEADPPASGRPNATAPAAPTPRPATSPVPQPGRTAWPTPPWKQDRR
jgi:hypothetical protein